MVPVYIMSHRYQVGIIFFCHGRRAIPAFCQQIISHYPSRRRGYIVVVIFMLQQYNQLTIDCNGVNSTPLEKYSSSLNVIITPPNERVMLQLHSTLSLVSSEFDRNVPKQLFLLSKLQCSFRRTVLGYPCLGVDGKPLKNGGHRRREVFITTSSSSRLLITKTTYSRLSIHIILVKFLARFTEWINLTLPIN